jgi:hypothetical protein
MEPTSLHSPDDVSVQQWACTGSYQLLHCYYWKCSYFTKFFSNMFRSLLGSSSGILLKTNITHTAWQYLVIKCVRNRWIYTQSRCRSFLFIVCLGVRCFCIVPTVLRFFLVVLEEKCNTTKGPFVYKIVNSVSLSQQDWLPNHKRWDNGLYVVLELGVPNESAG